MADTNDLAFPTQWAAYDKDNLQTKMHYAPGMTKREYFAAMAMQGILANLHTFEQGKYSREGIQVTPSVTLLAVDVADMLIGELNKGETNVR